MQLGTALLDTKGTANALKIAGESIAAESIAAERIRAERIRAEIACLLRIRVSVASARIHTTINRSLSARTLPSP